MTGKIRGVSRPSRMSSGLPPIAGARARVLVLGTLPSVLSLQRQEYYANSRNAFWRIMGELIEARPELAYGDRVSRLRASGIAVWDVCRAAHRPGSLDAAMRSASIVTNDFRRFFREHPEVCLVCLNGAKAAALYERRVKPTLSQEVQGIERALLPSTSPAHARMTFEQKLQHWGRVFEVVSR